MDLHFYNTLSKHIQQFAPIDANEVKMYSCGPTVYNHAHIGNMRSFLFADLLQRVLRTVGEYKVRWVMNITDIDDKTIRDSAIGAGTWLPGMGEQSSDVLANLGTFTEYFTKEFLDDLHSLHIDVRDIDTMPRATHYIPQMQKLILDILDAGFAYVSDGSVYFDVAKYVENNAYGRLFHIDTENFRKGVRIDADEYDRESVSDFVLWKGKKNNEPAWDFTVNGENLVGRPGWHIECSAMSRDLLGLPFDIHTGGVDLRFPHHEDELAQCTAGYHVPEQANYWMHHEFLEVEGKKMSKSLGNFYTLRDVVNKGIDPIDVRYAMLSVHYRGVYNFTFDSLQAARKTRANVQEFIWKLGEGLWDSVSPDISYATDVAKDLRYAVFSRLADDLHTPTALAALYGRMNEIDIAQLSDHERISLLNVLGQINEVFQSWEISERPVLVIPEDIKALADERWLARQARNWPEADRLRIAISDRGWSMLDGKESYTLEQQS